MTRENSFSAGDLVLAKLSGYPWWPGIVIREDQVNDRVLASKPRQSKVWPILFFPDIEYIWAKESNLKKLTSNEIQEFLKNPKAKRNDLLKAYQKAQNPPKLEEIHKEEPLSNEGSREEDQGEEVDNEPVRPAKKKAKRASDDDFVARQEILASKKQASKASKSRKPVEAKKVKIERKPPIESAKHEKLSRDTRSLETGQETKVEPKLTEEEEKINKQKKWEHRRDSVMYLRHKLQRALLVEGKEPAADEVEHIDYWMAKLEKMSDLDIALLRVTKIGKVMKRIIHLPEIPNGEKIKIKGRARNLLIKWEKIMGVPTSNNMHANKEEA